MDVATLPPNIYHRLMLANGALITVNSPLPGTESPNVWLIVFVPGETESVLFGEGEKDDENPPEGELRRTVPPKYHLLMHDSDSGDDGVQIHEIWADKVLLATRLSSQEAALEEFTALIKEELGSDVPVELGSFTKKPNGQTATQP